MNAEIALRPINLWLDKEELKLIYSSPYWNSIAEEQGKEWWTHGGGACAEQRLRKHLDDSGVMAEYKVAERAIAQLEKSDLNILDVAAGTGWTSALLSKLPCVSSVHAVDISQHRLELLFPESVRIFSGVIDKLNRYLGSFYDLKFENRSMDVALLSQAFHHAQHPLKLFMEVDRILKPRGHIVLIGENFMSVSNSIKRALKILITQMRLCTNFYELFPPDNDSGDHYYRISDYHFFMQLMGYKVIQCSVQKNRSIIVIAEKSAER